MYAMLLQTFKNFRQDDKGVTLVEYGIAIALAIGVGTTALSLLSGDITGAMGTAGALMP